MDELKLIGRTDQLFAADIHSNNDELLSQIQGSRILVIGGAGSIGQSVAKAIFKRNPKCLHIVDINENNLVELVRDIRSTLGYGPGEFKTYSLDCGSIEFELLVENEGPYDYVFNLSALKHVRSEKDPFTLMRMVLVNIFNTIKIARMAKRMGTKKYFCVSTDKAANPVNMMGASKRIMEMFLLRESLSQEISMARFANVAFSDGSLLDGFNQRFRKEQPISAPKDVRRYFVTNQESGELCLLSGILGKNRDVFFPKLNEDMHLTTFSEIAVKFLNARGFEAYRCHSEAEARGNAKLLISQKKWPCYFFESDTTGEKPFEEFFTKDEVLDMQRFESIGVIKNTAEFNSEKLDEFASRIESYRSQGSWNKEQIVELFCDILPDFKHSETGKNLDQRM